MRNLTEAEEKALEMISVTPEQVAEFMAEYDAGLHPIPKLSEEQLEASWQVCLAKLKAMKP